MNNEVNCHFEWILRFFVLLRYNRSCAYKATLNLLLFGCFLQAGCSTMSSAQSGDISSYHLSGEYTTLDVMIFSIFLYLTFSAWLSLCDWMLGSCDFYPDCCKCVFLSKATRGAVAVCRFSFSDVHLCVCSWMSLTADVFMLKLYNASGLVCCWRLSVLQNIWTCPIIGLSLVLEVGDKAVKVLSQMQFILGKPGRHRLITPLKSATWDALTFRATFQFVRFGFKLLVN